MICARCNQPIKYGQLYHQTHRRGPLPDDMHAMDSTVTVHDYPCPTHDAVGYPQANDQATCRHTDHPVNTVTPIDKVYARYGRVRIEKIGEPYEECSNCGEAVIRE